MKEDTKWRLRDSEGKEYIIIDSEKIDMQEELNKMITKQMKEIERLNNIIDKAIEYIEQGIWSNGIDEEKQYSLHIPTLLEILKGEDKEWD